MHEVKHSTAASVSIAIQLRRGRGIPGASLRLKTNHGFVWSLSKADILSLKNEIPMIPYDSSNSISELCGRRVAPFNKAQKYKASTTHRGPDPYDRILLFADALKDLCCLRWGDLLGLYIYAKGDCSDCKRVVLVHDKVSRLDKRCCSSMACTMCSPSFPSSPWGWSFWR